MVEELKSLETLAQSAQLVESSAVLERATGVLF